MTADIEPGNAASSGVTRRQGLQLAAAAVVGKLPGGEPVRAAGHDVAATPEIWDGHCHLGSIPGNNPRDRMANLLRYADRMRIQRLVVFMGWPFAMEPSPDELRRQNDQVLAAITGWPERTLGYAYVSPEHPDASLREMERCIAKGPMVGIKLWVAKRCSDSALDPILEFATKLQVPVYQHTWLKITGNLPGESTPMDLALLARRHPQAVLFCGHAGGDWEQGIRAIRSAKNVYLDIAGGDPTAGIVDMAVRELGADRIVYGSDAGGRSFASQLAKVESARIDSEQKARILGGNLRRLLTPVLTAKGIEF